MVSKMMLSTGLLAALLLTSSAEARKVENIFRGEIVLLKRSPPTRFRSNGAFVHFLRSNRLKVLWPPKKDPSSWELRYMAFFKRVPNDFEVKVRFYDITEGRTFVAADSIYLGARNQRILSSTFALEKPKFRPQRKYVMYVLTARNVLLASGTFQLGGEVEHYSGHVDFSEEEVK